jgi:hypothetical protein
MVSSMEHSALSVQDCQLTYPVNIWPIAINKPYIVLLFREMFMFKVNVHNCFQYTVHCCRLLFLFVATRWFKYDRDYLCVNKSQFVPVIFEPPCTC